MTKTFSNTGKTKKLSDSKIENTLPRCFKPST